MRRTLSSLAIAAMIGVGLAAATPASAHYWSPYGPGYYGSNYASDYDGWRERAWRHQQWREQAWRRHLWWRAHHGYWGG